MVELIGRHSLWPFIFRTRGVGDHIEPAASLSLQVHATAVHCAQTLLAKKEKDSTVSVSNPRKTCFIPNSHLVFDRIPTLKKWLAGRAFLITSLRILPLSPAALQMP